MDVSSPVCARVGCDATFVPWVRGRSTRIYCSPRCQKQVGKELYQRSPKGKASAKRHRESEKGRATKARCMKRLSTGEKRKSYDRWYRTTDKRKTALARYGQSEKGKASAARYQASIKYKETHLRTTQRRRAIKRGAFIENVDIRVLIHQQNNQCSLCGGVFDGVAPNPLSSSLDHTIPLSRGGVHSYANCTAAHLGCNMSKGAKVLQTA